MPDNTLAAQIMVIAKEPVPGRVKTRLTPPYTPAEAAELAEAALTDTLAAVASAPVARRVLALAGTPGRWLPPGFDVIGQRGGGLDERIAWALADARAAHDAGDATEASTRRMSRTVRTVPPSVPVTLDFPVRG